MDVRACVRSSQTYLLVIVTHCHGEHPAAASRRKPSRQNGTPARPGRMPCFMFADAQSESILSLVGYLAGGSLCMRVW